MINVVKKDVVYVENVHQQILRAIEVILYQVQVFVFVFSLKEKVENTEILYGNRIFDKRVSLIRKVSYSTTNLFSKRVNPLESIFL